MDDDTQQLIAIQQELKQIADKLGKIFPSTHPQFDSVFEDVDRKRSLPPGRSL